MTTVFNFQKSYRFDLLKPFSQGGGVQSTNAGFETETLSDVRSPLVRGVWDLTPPKFRKPTSYARTIKSGDVKTFFLSCNTTRSDGWRMVGSGADSCGGAWELIYPAIPSYLDDAAITRALLKLKSMDVNYAQNLGERKQTANLVFDSCVRLARMGRDARNAFKSQRNFEKFFLEGFGKRNPAKTLANYWLELQYGWKPLLQDVHSAVTTLMNDLPDRRMTSVSAKVKVGVSEVKTISSTKPPGAIVLVDRVMRGVQNVHVRLDYLQDDNPTLSSLAQAGLTNPADLAWELLPFSFVVDWFIPIGDFFNCLDATVGWQFRGGSITRTQRYNVKVGNPRWNGGGWSGGLAAVGKAYHVKTERFTYNTSPLPARPHFKDTDKAASLHVANGLALLASAFLGGSHVR